MTDSVSKGLASMTIREIDSYFQLKNKIKKCRDFTENFSCVVSGTFSTMVIGFLFHSLPFVWGAFMVGIMSSCVVALVFCKCKILEKQIRQWQLRIIKENNIVTLNDVFTLKNIIRRSLDNVVFLLCKSKGENEKKHYIE